MDVETYLDVTEDPVVRARNLVQRLTLDEKTLRETHLPTFKQCVQEGRASPAMSSRTAVQSRTFIGITGWPTTLQGPWPSL